ncbi:acylneuraminate cytidylyltransferase family protein [Thalassospira xianhensis]|uniref:Flagellar modification protein B n=1 Tax=Thalassospira xianhensis MCCC 1A02616 TaxID=1177929 RepID=A0A367UGD7_9PROT|nr:acylneuraminate cytidylyltransferase family protein [Thalassospira xianhensis]RCK07367.1 flagellar modification protein B [Thalassospira xianhensis MCCC 1A02616]
MSQLDKHTFLCTICARGGSKGVPGKNIRTLIDRPLIAYSIEQAKKAGIFTAVAVSSDSDVILDNARAYGADIIIKRPSELASDTAGKIPAIVHALETAEAELGAKVDYHFDLDATSPLRVPKDILACVDILLETGASNVITGTVAHRSPYFNLVERSKDGKVFLSKTPNIDVLRRQDSPDCFDMNGSIYGWKRDVLLEDPKLFYLDTQLYVMPRNRSVDIDEELDFTLVTLLMQERALKEEN